MIQAYTLNQIKSNHLYCHITTARVLWWITFLRAWLQTVQKQFTYRQYILTDLSRRQCAEYKYILSTHSVLFKTYLQLSIHIMHHMYTFYIMYTYIHTIVCEKSCSRFYIGRIHNVMDVCCMCNSPGSTYCHNPSRTRDWGRSKK